ncbi:MAG: hypothetical protein H0V00_13980, partial [Chloroflexia bacterium]|nr:hypothetical protein [Chloroflexia bacterium]
AVSMLDDTVNDLFVTGWHGALGLGYAVGHDAAPTVAIARETLCLTCSGTVRLWNGQNARPQGARASDAAPCTVCAGAGVVPATVRAAYHPDGAAALPAPLATDTV